MRAGLGFGAAAFVVGLSFGVVAQPTMGSVAPIVMSVFVFAGSAQFGATAVLASGGGAVTAIATGAMLNARFLAMGVAAAPALRGGPLRTRARGPGRGRRLVGARRPRRGGLRPRGAARRDAPAVPGLGAGDRGSACCWAGRIGDPADFGLDAVFPAFFLALLAAELGRPRAVPVVVSAGRDRPRADPASCPRACRCCSPRRPP